MDRSRTANILRKYAAGSNAGSGALGNGISGTEMMVLDMGDSPPYFGNTADFGVLPEGLIDDSEMLFMNGFEPLRLKIPMSKSSSESERTREKHYMQTSWLSEENRVIDDH